MNKTPIEWVKNPDGTQGYTWNPITGCLNHTDGMCKGGGFPCYAYRLANGRLKERYLANKNWDTRTPEGYEGYPNLDPFYPRFWEDRLNDLGNFDSPSKGIFVCDMGELFGDWIPSDWMREVMGCIQAYDKNRFYLLTKQPQNLLKFSPFPQNCWVGVTATNPEMLVEACYKMRHIEAKIKFISLEPLLDFTPLPEVLTWHTWIRTWLTDCGINQVIIGAQTKPYKPPKIEWVQEIVEACDKAGVAVFLKGNLKLALPFQKAEWAWARDRYATSHSTNVVYTGLLRQELPGEPGESTK